MRITSFVLLGAQLILPAVAQTASSPSSMFQLSSDPEFAFLLEEVLSHSNNFGANTGEVLRAASQIVPADFDSWFNEFLFLGDAIHAKAAAIDATRFPVSARQTYFRSATYYRIAPFFLHANQTDPRIDDLGVRALADFDAAVALLDLPPVKANLAATSSSVPGGEFYVPVRFFKGAADSTKRPTVIIGTGYDGTQEDLFHSNGADILARGWNVITYEGPGQPVVLRDQGLGFIPDWWSVVTPIIDYLATRDDVDMDQVALIGVSFGGNLAPRAASREHRLSAVLAIDAFTDLYATFADQFPPQLLDLYSSGNYSAFDAAILSTMRNASKPTNLRWALAQALFSFHTESPSDWWGRLPAYTNDAGLLGNITCPVFVGEGEDDTSAPGQAAQMVAALGDRSTYNLFRTDLGAGEHCQLGAEAQLAQVTLDWLADVWDRVSLPQNITGGTY